MSNPVTSVSDGVVAALTAGLASYTGVVIQPGLFRPASLPTFERYSVIVAPAARPLGERRIAIAMIQYVVRLDLYVLVKNWEQTTSPLFGTAAPNRGIFELINDVKVVLRASTLGGILDKTYDEPGGDSSSPAQGGGDLDFQDSIQGFDGKEHAFVHRARIPYVGRLAPFCHPRELGGGT